MWASCTSAITPSQSGTHATRPIHSRSERRRAGRAAAPCPCPRLRPHCSGCNICHAVTEKAGNREQSGSCAVVVSSWLHLPHEQFGHAYDLLPACTCRSCTCTWHGASPPSTAALSCYSHHYQCRKQEQLGRASGLGGQPIAGESIHRQGWEKGGSTPGESTANNRRISNAVVNQKFNGGGHSACRARHWKSTGKKMGRAAQRQPRLLRD